MNKTKVTTLVIQNKLYHVHTKRVLSGFTGYVIHEGDFLMSLPEHHQEQKVIDAADQRIRDFIS